VAPIVSESAVKIGMTGGEVVEINLLLPVRRAEALIDLSRRRRESVGQILRQLIDRALTAEALAERVIS
jgi:hypothetical protein